MPNPETKKKSKPYINNEVCFSFAKNVVDLRRKYTIRIDH